MTTDIKQFLEDVLGKLAVEFDSVEMGEELGQAVYRISTKTPQIFIGANGDVLRSLNHIVKKTLQNRGIETRFMIDVNNYRTKQIEEIRSTAKLLAERALALKYDVEMQPMSPYERMIVHASLDGMQNIATESVGAGHNRRVVIKYTA